MSQDPSDHTAIVETTRPRVVRAERSIVSAQLLIVKFNYPRPRVVRPARPVRPYYAGGRGRLARGKDTTLVATMIVETTRPRVVRVVRPVLAYYDCGDVKRRQVRKH